MHTIPSCKNPILRQHALEWGHWQCRKIYFKSITGISLFLMLILLHCNRWVHDFEVQCTEMSLSFCSCVTKSKESQKYSPVHISSNSLEVCVEKWVSQEGRGSCISYACHMPFYRSRPCFSPGLLDGTGAVYICTLITLSWNIYWHAWAFSQSIQNGSMCPPKLVVLWSILRQYICLGNVVSLPGNHFSSSEVLAKKMLNKPPRDPEVLSRTTVKPCLVSTWQALALSFCL